MLARSRHDNVASLFSTRRKRVARHSLVANMTPVHDRIEVRRCTRDEQYCSIYPQMKDITGGREKLSLTAAE